MGFYTSLSLYICFFLLSFLKGGTSDFSVAVHLFLSFVFSKRVGLQISPLLYICFFLLSFLKGGTSDFSVTVHLFLSFVFSKRWDFRLLCHCTFVSFFCLF